MHVICGTIQQSLKVKINTKVRNIKFYLYVQVIEIYIKWSEIPFFYGLSKNYFKTKYVQIWNLLFV